MSYANMDHAGWLSSQLRRPVEGFEAIAADIIGMTWNGIYNAPINWQPKDKKKPDTARGWEPIGVPCRAVLVTIYDGGRLATWDFDHLTRFVFLCHAARVRGAVAAHTRNYFRIVLSQRSHSGGMSGRHPDLAEAVDAFRAYLPTDHRIIYRQPPNEAMGKDGAG